MRTSRGWLGARRLMLKARYAAEQTSSRVRSVFGRRQTSVPLDAVRRRLELVLSAAYGRPIAIAPTVISKWNRLGALATIDGETIKLPSRLPIHGDERRTVDRYRLLAIQQAERLTRGTARQAPPSDPLERDLYLLREGAAIDARIARTFPGVLRALEAEHANALARRPRLGRLSDSERAVEQMLLDTLRATGRGDAQPSSSPEASLEWARERAAEIRARGGSGTYRGLSLASAWGTATRSGDGTREISDEQRTSARSRKTEAGSQGGARDDSRSDANARDPESLTAPPSDDGSGNERESDEDRDSTLPDTSSADAPSGGQPLSDMIVGPPDPGTPPGENLPAAIYYDEWDSDHGVYKKHGAAVRLYDAPEANPKWLRGELAERAGTVRQIKTQFERLRARRTSIPRQLRGDSLDLQAVVDAMIDRTLGGSPDDRFYVDARPARRGLAIALLIDASGSTDQRVTEAWRIIDIEKIAAMLACAALDSLGDLYAIYAFAGRQATNVKLTVLKDFGEANGETVTRRLAALDSGGFTRLGATVRHATRQLSQQTAGHRLLLILSDGRPNDLDAYQGAYGVEDARQAVLEARTAGVFPYCLTVDKDASEYLPRIFGATGHMVLQRPEQMPKALLSVVKGLIQR